MLTDKNTISRKELFTEMVLGVLLYSVVLGFFNDYTDILQTSSYSTTFALAVVMQLLTFVTLKLKDRVVKALRVRQSKNYTLVISIWLIVFFSKFVFLAFIAAIFKESVEISGFIGLLIIIICFTGVQAIIEFVENKLEN